MTGGRIGIIGGGVLGQLIATHLRSFGVTSVVMDWRRPDAAGWRGATRLYGANYLWEPLSLPGLTGMRSFTVETRIDHQFPTDDRILAYKARVGRTAATVPDRWRGQFRPTMTGYDFDTWPEVPMLHDFHVASIDTDHRLVVSRDGVSVRFDWLVSTIPLYALLRMLGWHRDYPSFTYRPISVTVTGRPPDAPYPPEVLYVNYMTDPAVPVYRTTDRDGERHYEAIDPMDRIPTRRLTPGKIYPHPMRNEIVSRLMGYHILPYGRYGTWEPEELIHQTLRQVQQWTPTNLAWS
jgi:hypothetical protein